LEQPWNIVPKATRLALLAIICTIAFKGVQALISPPPTIRPEEFHQVKEESAETNKLIKQLLANSKAQAAPSAEKSLSEAVVSATEGAEAGDIRLAKALELLKENKVGEAESLFRAVAVEKAARIQKDSKDAAKAYRNLGAIAGLRDPKSALEAYEKAASLDPGD
jgi:hypothetical protein